MPALVRVRARKPTAAWILVEAQVPAPAGEEPQLAGEEQQPAGEEEQTAAAVKRGTSSRMRPQAHIAFHLGIASLRMWSMAPGMARAHACALPPPKRAPVSTG